MPVLQQNQVEDLRNKMLDEFWFFSASMQGEEWFDKKLHRDLCDFLQYAGRKKAVILPRTFLKTTYAGELYPLWRSIEKKIKMNIDLRSLVTSNSAPNAEKSVHQIRAWVETHPIIQQFFPEVIPNFNKTRWSDRGACLMRTIDFPEATFESAGIGTNIIRRHFNLVIQDDTIAPSKDALTGNEAMPTREDIEKAIGFHKLTVPLLIDPNIDERLVIATRWAARDLIQHIMDNEKFAIFNRKAVENGKTTYFRFSESTLAEIKDDMGTYMFSMLYLNQPLSSEFMKFRPNWIQDNYYKEQPKEGKVFITIDPADAPTGKRTQDYTSIVVCLHNDDGIFVLHYLRNRLTEGELVTEGMDLAERYKTNIIKVEVNKYPNLEQAFRDEMRRRDVYYSFEGVKVVRKKEERILVLSPLMENGRLHLRSDMRELEEEFFTFPRGKHDDIIDALSLQMHGYKAVGRRKEKDKEKSYRFFPTREEILEELFSAGDEGYFTYNN